MRHSRWMVVALMMIGACSTPPARVNAPDEKAESARTVRVATFNVSFFARQAGAMQQSLRDGAADKRKVAAIIQRVRPDIVLLNEFDYEADAESVALFRGLLRAPQGSDAGIDYPFHFRGPVNTGMPSGLDLDHDGKLDGPADAWGFGAYPGQYGMLVLSRYPIDPDALRSFQNFRWADMPDAMRPQAPGGNAPYYDDTTWRQLRLSSKSHWDLPIDTPLGRVHVLAMHPTPPIFDGDEDRNGRRNHDEIRLFADYIDPQRAQYLIDDQGRRGDIDDNAAFVILGDLNADPLDGESVPGAIGQLLDHPLVNARFVPRSAGALAKSVEDGAPNPSHRGDPASDTGDFFEPASGNLRIDYVLPSQQLEVADGGVFWPAPDSPDAALADASDHHLVWLDLRSKNGNDAR